MPLELRMPLRRATIRADEPESAGRPSMEVEHEPVASNVIASFDKFDARAQPFIRMRSQLIHIASDTGQRVFAITSAEPGAGKTHIAINLAAALSRITPTALVELDLRRPSIATRLGLSRPRRGIDDFLDGSAVWNELGWRIRGFALDVYSVRAPRGNAENLLTSEALQSLFDHLRAMEEQPICIVDTSPMTVEDDFMLIAPAVDGVLMVVEEGRTSRRQILEAAASLKATPIIGTILNRSMWSPGHGSYYGSYSGT